MCIFCCSVIFRGEIDWSVFSIESSLLGKVVAYCAINLYSILHSPLLSLSLHMWEGGNVMAKQSYFDIWKGHHFSANYYILLDIQEVLRFWYLILLTWIVTRTEDGSLWIPVHNDCKLISIINPRCHFKGYIPCRYSCPNSVTTVLQWC